MNVGKSLLRDYVNAIIGCLQERESLQLKVTAIR